MKVFLFSLTILTSLSAIGSVLPFVTRLEGIGAGYGAIYLNKQKKSNFVLGASLGDIKGVGLLYSYQLADKWKLSAGAAKINDLNFETTYLRGLQDDEDYVYTQHLDLTGFMLKADYDLVKDVFKLNIIAGKSSVAFRDFEDKTGVVKLPGANLFDVETTMLSLGYLLKKENDKKTKMLAIGGSFTSLSGRKGQSDHLVTNYHLALRYPLQKSLLFKFKAHKSQAKASSTKYDNEATIRSTFGVKCSSLTNSSERSRCEKLENQLVNYVLDHNTKGTANPVGGSASVRSFRELRFKAANTAFYSSELELRLSDYWESSFLKGDKSLGLVVFYDVAYANDSESALRDKSYYSKGAGVNFNHTDTSIKLQYATGSIHSNAWFLTLGKAI